LPWRVRLALADVVWKEAGQFTEDLVVGGGVAGPAKKPPHGWVLALVGAGCVAACVRRRRQIDAGAIGARRRAATFEHC
jgi:hypothetical protein